MDEEALAFNQ